MAGRSSRALPGFGLSLGYAGLYMSLLVLIPLAALGLKSATLSFQSFRDTVTDEFVLAALRLSLTTACAAAILNGVLGTIAAWTLVRYTFPGRKIFDAIIDLPFALPTAVAGLTFSDSFTAIPTFIAWLGGVLPSGISTGIGSAAGWISTHVPMFSADWADWWRITIMLTFVGLPYVIRSMQPVLQDWDMEVEQAAMSLGAGPVTIFRRIIAWEVYPAWLSGMALAFARGVGEYGSVIFVSGNLPGKSQIVPQLIVEKVFLHEVPKATAISLVLLLISLMILMFLNALDWWSRRHSQ